MTDQQFVLTPDMNTGCLGIKEDPNMYVAGVNSPLGDLSTRILNPDAAWAAYASDFEIQYNPNHYFDTQNCTGFSYCHVVGLQINFMIANKLISEASLNFLKDNGYLDASGKVNFSERFVGIMSGTGANGNYLNAVTEAMRKFGMIPGSLLPWDYDQQANLPAYYNRADVTQAMLDLGQQFLKFFSLQYEAASLVNTPSVIEPALKACPLYVALCTCSGWNTPPVPWCGITQTNHAVALTAAHPEVQDSYAPFIKLLNPDYQIPFHLKVLVQDLGTSNMTIEFVHRAGTREYGFVETGVLGEHFYAASDENHLKEMANLAKINILNTDGNINFAAAKEITL